jgi:hypothetical protein
VKIYACPKGKGIEMNNWKDIEDSILGGMFYKLNKSGDFCVIAPLLKIKSSSVIGFPIQIIGTQHVSTFVPIRATSDNVDGHDEVTESPFGLGLFLRGIVKEYDTVDVDVVSPVRIKSYATGKVEIDGIWTKFSSRGYVVMGLEDSEYHTYHRCQHLYI